MNFNEYQKKAQTTAQFPTDITLHVSTYYENPLPWIYPAIGLAGETGELLNKLKKVIRDNEGVITENMNMMIIDEIGDVMWYIAMLCNTLGYDMDIVMNRNVSKLAERMKNNTIKGNGDNR